VQTAAATPAKRGRRVPWNKVPAVSEVCPLAGLSIGYESLIGDEVRLFHTLDRAVDARVKVPSDNFVLVAKGLLLNGVAEDQHAVICFDGADGRLDQRPQVVR
jgi:hypothetical protein